MLNRDTNIPIGLEVEKKSIFLFLLSLTLISNILIFTTSDLFSSFLSIIVLFYFFPGFVFCLIFLRLDEADYAIIDIIVLSVSIGIVISTFY
ncbi:MAG: hypothetical protein ACFFCQ_15520 [Promethearchaeota archaeon]